eukprot:TRINITY_DN13993_c1_g5_i1.p1 TRINITY_DN13993_c1_g5~~TRINITY_DN13993_c1_g5_i1.p1  ORF type:complete len:257 (+),score=42.65 TRINITY_DN13993_c1_g5_i1:150-920(+)
MSMQACREGNRAVLLLWPNVVCYMRLVMALVTLVLTTFDSSQTWAVTAVTGIYCLNMALDGLDGFLARLLGQASELGASLDLIVDNLSRGTIWSLAIRGPLGTVPLFLEMLVFLCTHAEGSGAWKTECFANAPGFVSAVMKNGFRTPLGALTVAGLHFLPLWLWLAQPLWDQGGGAAKGIAVSFVGGVFIRHRLPMQILGAALLLGRCVAASVEVWVVSRHFGAILQRDVRQRRVAAPPKADDSTLPVENCSKKAS